MKKAGTLLWIACFLFAFVGCHRERAPSRDVKVWGTVGAWQLTDHNGELFESTKLAEKPYVVSFFFTSCQTVCPRISGTMARLQEVLEQENIDAQLLSITVDPDTDVPERLAAYAKKWGAKSTRWNLLTGSESELKAVVVGVFKTFMGKKEPNEDGLLDIGHGSKLILVDGKSKVRGLFEAKKESVEEVVWTLKQIQEVPE